MNWLLVCAAMEAAADDTLEADRPHPWGVETDLIWPVIPGVRVVTIKGTRTVFGAGKHLHGDAVGGIYLRPRVAHDVVETIDEYLVAIGFRQFLWHGLHVEALHWVGFSWGWNNHIDGQNYANPAWLVEVNGGWQLQLLPRRPVGLTIAPQGGFMKGIHTDIGPREDPDFFVTGRLLVGVSF